MQDKQFEELTYFDKEPNVKILQTAYEETIANLEPYFHVCRRGYDDRRNEWSGKSDDMRKRGVNAFPWDGASDLESHVINERVRKIASMLTLALKKANVKAMPRGFGDLKRSKVVGQFIKWMYSSGYIDRFYEEAELNANYFLEKDIMVTYVGWHQEKRRYLQSLSLEQIFQISPEIVALVQEGKSDDQLAALLMRTFDGTSEAKAKKAIQELRETGQAELPTIKKEVDAPCVKTLSPSSDFFFPSYVTDPQRAPYCFWRTYYTAQELRNKIITDGWDEDVVDHLIKTQRGVSEYTLDGGAIETTGNLRSSYHNYRQDDLIEIIHCYQRLIDEEDNSEGIYETIMHRTFSGDPSIGLNGYLKFRLMNGYEDYPIVVTKLSEDSKRLYDVYTVPAQLRGIQNQIKVERDSRVDRNSMATLPPMLHPVGNLPKDWGPGRKVPYRRKGEFEFGPTPDYDPGSVEIEERLERTADRITGLDFEDPTSAFQREFMVNKFLSHMAKVLSLAFKCYQRFGPEQTMFKVVGSADPLLFQKGDPEENFSITVTYDLLNNDPEMLEKRIQMISTLPQFDRNGRISVDALLEIIVNSIDPVIAENILQPVEEAQERVIKEVTDDLAKIFAGIEVPARPVGAQVAVQLIQSYMQQPDIQQRLSVDEAFRERLEKYMGQYVFQLQQAQNAQIGKIGTAPAQMGGVSTQDMQQ